MSRTEDEQWELDGALFEAAERGETYRAENLLAAGANVMARDGGQMTPLHSAAVSGNLGVFMLLVQKGADIEAKTVRGKTPLDLANLNGQMEVSTFIMAGKPPAAAAMKTIKFKTPAAAP
jgi:ankyrin repeat protein